MEPLNSLLITFSGVSAYDLSLASAVRSEELVLSSLSLANANSGCLDSIPEFRYRDALAEFNK